MLPNQTSFARAWVYLEWIALAVFAGILGMQTLPSAFGSLQTDFPNYYLTARLATERVDVAHVYEWRWIARQKDHHQIDRDVIGLVPITPFSTLILTPIARFDVLTAKRIWLVLQLLLLFPIALALRAITGQPLRRIALVIVACMPLHRNLLYGQFYILLAALLIAACWAHQRKYRVLAGTLVALATAIKLFPAILLLYFLRKREWRALIAALVAGAVCAAISISIFDWEVHRTYLQQILPWTLRGDALPPYALGSGSLSTLLHCLFLYEPQWNPHPWHASPALFATLQAVLPMLILAPALLLVDERDQSPSRIALEWSALTVATLTISPIPASYNFTLLVLPITVLIAALLERQSRLVWLGAALFLGIGSPSGWHVRDASGLAALFEMQRLYLLIALVLLFYITLGITAWRVPAYRTRTVAFACALAILTAFQVRTGIHHQRNLSADFAFRLPDSAGAILAASPTPRNGAVLRIAMQPGGYRLLPGMNTPPASGPWPEHATGPDDIAVAATSGMLLVEEAGAHSTITARTGNALANIPDAESPVLSSDQRHLAYLRVDRGRGQLFVRALDAPTAQDQPMTPASLNVEQATFLPDASLIVAALVPESSGSRLLRIQPGQMPELLPLGEARYPAVSPDGHWLAYSRMQRGNWNLSLFDLRTGAIKNIADAECNTTEPAWEPDSKTVVYSSDCGRGLWFTATSRRQIVP